MSKKHDEPEESLAPIDFPPSAPKHESKAFRPTDPPVFHPGPAPEASPALHVSAVTEETLARVRELCVEVSRIDKGGGVGQLAARVLAELGG